MRPAGMHTKDYLAQELDKVGLTEMATRARDGYYHDFLSPLDFPDLQLEMDLRGAAAACPDAKRAAAIEAVRLRHIHDGEFDADKAESDEWAASPDGQDAFNRLVKGG